MRRLSTDRLINVLWTIRAPGAWTGARRCNHAARGSFVSAWFWVGDVKTRLHALETSWLKAGPVEELKLAPRAWNRVVKGHVDVHRRGSRRERCHVLLESPP
jgi:hypothetical protein